MSESDLPNANFTILLQTDQRLNGVVGYFSEIGECDDGMPLCRRCSDGTQTNKHKFWYLNQLICGKKSKHDNLGTFLVVRTKYKMKYVHIFLIFLFEVC